MPNEPRLFHFPQGIPGFEDHHDFQFILEEEAWFAHLISVQEERIRFILLRPEAYFPEYLKEMDVDEESVKALNISVDTPVDVWVMLTLHRQELAKTTVNLRAPLLFNITEGLGIQAILKDDRYLSRQLLFTEETPHPRQEGAVG